MYFVEHRVRNVYLIQKRYRDLWQRWEWSTVLNTKKTKARYVTWTSYFLSTLQKQNIFYQMFLVLFPYGTRCKVISKRLNFVTKNIEGFIWERETEKQPNNCFVWVCEFVISCRYRKSADVSILRIRIKSVKLYTRHWYRL